ncbi:hypothetical protein [Gorillibacterium timonense]|uniref:hypothetical protein n=1 Tax=Gorillibacterium timonense TaxID=1689269 RepID=UPI00071C1FCE|nr:hypothetical protein [Gorillibacterium timonense]
MRKVRQGFMVLLMASLVVIGWIGASPAALAAGQAKTSPPPPSFQLYSSYSGYTYLLSSSRTIKDNKNQTIDITPVTQAKSTVAVIGAKIQFQEWSGASWVNVNSQIDLSSTNASYFQKTATKAARAGYYYRACVTHYVIKSGVTELAMEYTDSILVS